MAKETEKAENPRGGLVAIVGRPNVGKSTLFNRLVGRRRAIVGDEPGITRDRLYGDVRWNGRRFRVVDTGGIIPEDKELIPSEIFRQAKVALEEASAFVMVVDGRTELAAPDMELARLLRKLGKPMYLAVNKIDAPKLEAAAENYRRLGVKELLSVSAEHGNGVAELVEALMEVVPTAPETAESEEQVDVPEGDEYEDVDEESQPSRREWGTPGDDGGEPEEARRSGRGARGDEFEGDVRIDRRNAYATGEVKVAIIGKPNVGKSTLLNRLTGSTRAIVSPIPGTTRDAVDEIVEKDGQKYRFIDTAGIRRKGKTHLMAEKLSVVMARKHLEAADVALMVIDATQGVTALDANIAGYAHESGRSVVVVINKWDLVTTARMDGKPPADRKIYEEQARRALKFLDYAPMLFISAATGKSVDKVFSTIELVAKERRKRVTTGEMNRFLKQVDFERASVPSNRQVKIFYMTQAAVSPPTFILFTDKDVKLHFSYERFLQNQIREAFGFVGTPIWIKNRARGKGK